MGPVEFEPFDPMFYTSSMRPHYRKDIDLIEKAKRTAAKLIPHLRDKSYETYIFATDARPLACNIQVGYCYTIHLACWRQLYGSTVCIK
jgi:hypothetical protein